MRKILLTLPLILLTLTAFGQQRTIVGDTAFWYRWQVPFVKTAGLSDFSTSPAPFSLRFKDHNQVVEVHQDNDGSWGTFTNFSYWTRKRGADRQLVFTTDTLTPGATDSVLQLYHRLKLAQLPTVESLEGWRQGFDGVTYLFETTSDSVYNFKHYWTPASQDSLAEALVILEFLDCMEKITHRERRRDNFFAELPRKGSYTVGSMGITSMLVNATGVGYLGTTRLPLGIALSQGLNYLGLLRLDLHGNLQYRTDLRGNYTIRGKLSKYDVFIRKRTKSDHLVYNYRQSRLDFISESGLLRNHQLLYGMSFNHKTGISIGADISTGLRNQTGFKAGLARNVGNNLFLYGEASFFTSGTDFLVEATVDFMVFRKRWFVNLGYEKYLTYRDLRFGLSTSFH